MTGRLVCLLRGHRWETWPSGHGFLKICSRCTAVRRLS